MPKAPSHLLQTENKQLVTVSRDKIGFSTIAAEGEEVGLPGFEETSQTAWHEKVYTSTVSEYGDTQVSDAQVSAQKRGANLGHPATPVPGQVSRFILPSSKRKRGSERIESKNP
jgi:hypothetical protein